MTRPVVLLVCLGACVPALWMARQAPESATVIPPVVSADAAVKSLPVVVDLPTDFEWQHAGTLEELTPFVHLMPEGTALSDFTFVGATCRIQVAPGNAPKPVGDCPEFSAGHDGGRSHHSVPLQARLFGRDLKAGVWPVLGLGSEHWTLTQNDLVGLKNLLDLPVGLGDVPVRSLRAVAGPQGHWIGLELKMESTPIAQFSRWQLAMRYGSDPTYGRDVLSWGDGQRLLWVVRLPGGGFGMEMMPQRLRFVLISGSDWEARLSELLRALPSTQGSFPVPGYEGLSVTVIPEGLQMVPEESPLPTRALLGQLRGVLKRWSSP
ncbi:MAG: hypothetical protein VX405_08390 [Myxococcota bacterium]|nr:hypothetical protein [Myxococcota bacterium]